LILKINKNFVTDISFSLKARILHRQITIVLSSPARIGREKIWSKGID